MVSGDFDGNNGAARRDLEEWGREELASFEDPCAVDVLDDDKRAGDVGGYLNQVFSLWTATESEFEVVRGNLVASFHFAR